MIVCPDCGCCHAEPRKVTTAELEQIVREEKISAWEAHAIARRRLDEAHPCPVCRLREMLVGSI